MIAVLADQSTKYLALNSEFGSFLDLLKPVAAKQVFLNSRFAFSIPLPQPAIYAVYAALLSLIFRHIAKNFRQMPTAQRVGWLFVLSGSLSNVGERIVLGYVRDFIYILTGIFNLADGYIIMGIVILLFGNWHYFKRNKSSN